MPLLLAACAPALDWRDVHPAGTTLQLQLPCRPSEQKRSVALAGAPVTLTLNACSAAGQTWGVAHADVGDPARVALALQALRDGAAANIGAAPGAALVVWPVPGATPSDHMGRATLVGRTPDGEAVQMQLAVFAHGTRVFQATALGPQLPAAAAELFFGSLRFAPR